MKKKRKRRSSNKAERRVQRNTIDITKEIDLLDSLRLEPYRFSVFSKKKRIGGLDDKRYHDPTRSDRKYIDGNYVEYEFNRKREISRGTPLNQTRVAFKYPEKVIVCKRRKERRESLFALNRIGKGKGRKFKKRKITEDSKISCRR